MRLLLPVGILARIIFIGIRDLPADLSPLLCQVHRVNLDMDGLSRYGWFLLFERWYWMADCRYTYAYAGQKDVKHSLFSNLGGHIPTQVGTMESLQYFSFYDAYLTGTIPSQLGNCAKLETLDLSYNDKLGGLVPTELGQFEGLEYFDLDANYFNSTLFISNVFLTNDNSSSILTSTSWPWPPNLTFSVFTTIRPLQVNLVHFRHSRGV
eukprot:scaffold205220_cov51-Attheya_sp.AAC.1